MDEQKEKLELTEGRIMIDRSDILFRRVLIFFGFLFYFLSVVRGYFFEEPGLVDVFMSFAMCVIAVVFCIVDYRMRGERLVRSFHWLIFFTWPVALPVYLLYTRGMGKGIVAILLLLGGVCIVTGMAYGTACLIWAVWG